MIFSDAAISGGYGSITDNSGVDGDKGVCRAWFAKRRERAY
jgi:hypothetical protein